MCGRNNDDQPPLEESFGTWTLRDCADCGFVYLDKAPTSAAHPGFNSTNTHRPGRQTRLSPFSQWFSKLTRVRLHLLPRLAMPDLVEVWANPGPVVDLCCGDGSRLDDMSTAFIPFGVEHVPALARLADQRFSVHGGACVNAPVLEALETFADNAFAAAILRSCLEHEIEPQRILHELQRVLVPGGVAIVKVPNYGSLNRKIMGEAWCGFRFPDHLNYFTPLSLRKMGRKAGFTAHYGLTYTLPTSDNMYVVFKKDGGSMKRYSRCRGG